MLLLLAKGSGCGEWHRWGDPSRWEAAQGSHVAGMAD